MEFRVNILLIIISLITFSLNAMELGEQDKQFLSYIDCRHYYNVLLAVDDGANPNAVRPECTKTSLMRLADSLRKLSDSDSTLLKLIDKGANPKIATVSACSCPSQADHPQGTTILHYLARRGHSENHEIMRVLAYRKGYLDANATDINGESPIVLAARYGYLKTVYLLLSEWHVIPDQNYDWAQWLCTVSTKKLDKQDREDLEYVSDHFFYKGLLDFHKKSE